MSYNYISLKKYQKLFYYISLKIYQKLFYYIFKYEK
jgi:hypothetical protein